VTVCLQLPCPELMSTWSYCIACIATIDLSKNCQRRVTITTS